MLVLLLYWASQLILSFQVPILMPRAVLRTIATIAWDTDQISRSSSLSAPTRLCRIYLFMFLERCEAFDTVFMILSLEIL